MKAKSPSLLLGVLCYFGFIQVVGATDPDTCSPITSYQYYDWPGDQNLTFNKSASVSYYYNGPPIIITQPVGQLIKQGQTAALSVSVDGSTPLTYQWRINGVAIDSTNSAVIQIPNAQPANSGAYSVVVTNSYGLAVSNDANLFVYLPAPGPTPTPPPIQPSNQPPPISGSPPPTGTLYGVSSNGQLQPNPTLDPTKMTVVLTHGWLTDVNDQLPWPIDMAVTLNQQHYPTNPNIVVWDWHQGANPNGATWNSSASAKAVSLTRATANTYGEGRALGAAIFGKLGSSYNNPLHFCGHSLGNLVNRVAVEYLHGDINGSPGQADSSKIYPAQNIQITLFDEAELATTIHGTFNDVRWIWDGLIHAPTSLSMSVIPAHPERYALIDNYVSLVGFLHPECVNTMLWRQLALDAPTAHGYAYNWYLQTIPESTTLGSRVGHRWSFERNTVSISNPSQPAEGTYFTQSNLPSGSELMVTDVRSDIQAFLRQHLVGAFPYLAAYDGIGIAGWLALQASPSAVQYAGNAAANIIEGISVNNGTGVYIGTAGSTPAYFAAPSPSQGLQAFWNLQLTLGAGASNQNSNVPTTRIGSSASSSVASYVTMPVMVPTTAVAFTFEYEFEDAGENDFIAMGIGEDNYFTVPAKYSIPQTWNTSPPVDIADFAGQQIQMTFVLNSMSGTPTGTLQVRGIQFLSPPPPKLSLTISGQQARLAWPISAANWTLEANRDLSNPNGWATVNLTPTDTDFGPKIILDITGEKKFFFRLRK